MQTLTLTDGGQAAPDVARRLADFLRPAHASLDLALYDVRLPGEAGDIVVAALNDAAARGVRIRLLYNVDCGRPAALHPPPQTRPDILERLPLDARAISGVPDLMHHKYAVRDGAAVWTGSPNWTIDSWTRQENVVAICDSAGIGTAYGRNFEELWTSRDVERSGDVEPEPQTADGAGVRPWFTPGHGHELSQRIATAIGRAGRRVRIASPVITSAPILGTLAERAGAGDLDIAGVVDEPQTDAVFHQWAGSGASAWKIPLLESVLATVPFAGKQSTPWSPDSVHDFMHAKVTVADDTVFLGSFNLSRSGEMNAENVLEVADRALADRMAAFVDAIRGRYPATTVPATAQLGAATAAAARSGRSGDQGRP